MDFLSALRVIPERINKALLRSGHAIDPEKDVVAITGGGSGLGSYLTGLCVQAGFRVAVLDVVVPAENNRFRGAQYFACDVSRMEEVEEVRDKIDRKLGPVSVLINNAAITRSNTVQRLSYKDIEDVLRVNLYANFVTIKVFLPQMVAMERGYVVTIASVLGYVSPAKQSVYAASKAGVVSLHEALTHELQQQGHREIRTLMISPGQLNTNLFQDVVTPSNVLAPVLDPLDVAKTIIEALQHGREGEIRLPFYANFVPLLRAAPTQLAEIVRRATGIDTATQTNGF